MRVTGGGPDNTAGVARPVGTVACPGFDAHDWTAARVGTDTAWWQCTRCTVLATEAELSGPGIAPDYFCPTVGCFEALPCEAHPWPHATTSNGVVIVPGLRVRDYNWRETTVVGVSHTEDERDRGVPTGRQVTWFDTANGGMFDGSRLFALGGAS